MAAFYATAFFCFVAVDVGNRHCQWRPARCLCVDDALRIHTNEGVFAKVHVIEVRGVNLVAMLVVRVIDPDGDNGVVVLHDALH